MSFRKLVVRQLRETVAHLLSTPAKRQACVNCDVLALLLSGSNAEIREAETAMYTARGHQAAWEARCAKTERMLSEARSMLSQRAMAYEGRLAAQADPKVKQ